MDVLPPLGSRGLETSQPQGQAPPQGWQEQGGFGRKQKLPGKGRENLDASGNPSSFSQPWFQQSILLGQLVLKLLEGESCV